MTGIEEIKRQLIVITGEKNVFENEPMKNHTSFKLGGSADLLVTPESAESLTRVLRLLKNSGVPFYVIGNGTNLLVRDNGFRGVIIKLCGKMSRITVNGNEITAEAGALLSAVSKAALENSLTGLEFAEGIPGTLGGAVAMNAGAYGGEIEQVIISAEITDTDGGVIKLDKDGLELGYRRSILQRRELICLSATFRLNKGDKAQIKAKMDENRKQRTEKQPLDRPSAGSTFKRPEGYFAGKLIADSGLRGYSINGATVSEKHCGFIINNGNATSKDVTDLIEYVQKTVFEKFGVTLQPEVRIIGE